MAVALFRSPLLISMQFYAVFDECVSVCAPGKLEEPI